MMASPEPFLSRIARASCRTSIRQALGVARPVSGLAALVLSLACSGDDHTLLDPGVAGAGGQTAGGGTGGAGQAGAPGGSGGNGGTGSEQPSACVTGDDPFAWPAPLAVEVPAHASWKPRIQLPGSDVPADEFFSLPQGGGADEVRWVKFIVMASAPDEIHFHDAQTYPFHYEFARDRIPEFAGMSRAEFDAVTLRDAGRRAVLGAVLIPADSTAHPEYGVQLVSNDDLHPELVATVLATVAAHVDAPSGTSALYMPTSISAECIDNKRDELAARGVSVGSVDRWLSGDACYAPGWAIGRLVRLEADEVDAAYLDGRLTPADVLLLEDTPPAELPVVAGILTLAPSTPNAHTAILARSYAVPFAYVRQERSVARLAALEGRRVVVSTRGAAGRDPFVTHDPFAGCDVRVIDVDALAADDVAEVRALASPPPIEVSPKRAAGAHWLPADTLVPADIDRVGGKAAHFGVLRSAAPELTPSPARALTFDLWDAFMAMPAPNGGAGTLRDEIERRLAPYPWPADLRALDAALEGVRDLIEDAPFPDALAESVREALEGFDPSRRIRFRSSTNVEDSETFTGAGLYDSATGCLADDLDADSAGPSLCNPSELEERGVYRAIRRVYRSFYFRNAYIERLRRGVNEAQVAMGVLVHYSVPDPEELANGVATLNVDSAASRAAELVTQTGAVSVTNPEGVALPEQVRIDRYESDDYLTTRQTSTLLPLGAHVMTWEDDYRDLMDVFNRVADRYAEITDKSPPFALDFEYKKVTPGVLSLRQVRPLPLPDASASVTPFLVGAPQTLCVYGSERADAFATHRLKTRIFLDSDDLWLGAERLASPLYEQARIEYISGAAIAVLEGDPAGFPAASHALDTSQDPALMNDGWSAGGGAWALSARVPGLVPRSESPVRTFEDFVFDLAVTWSAPVPYLEFSFEPEQTFVARTRTEESVELWGFCPEAVTPDQTFPKVEASFTAPGGISVRTAYWFPPAPRGVTAGYTAPAITWDRTTITGLTSEPLVLTGYFSQTYAPYHHNFGGQYIFEPRLEPSIGAQSLAELEAANVAYVIVIDQDGLEDEVWVLGLDGALRRL